MGACAVAAVKLFTAACLIAGDSIALGLHHAMPECAVDAQNCIPSGAIIARVHPGYRLVIVSAGSNDARNFRLIANLRAIRGKTTARVIWIRPVDGIAGAAVEIVASDHHDATVGFAPGRDHVHPASDAALARAVRKKIKGE